MIKNSRDVIKSKLRLFFLQELFFNHQPTETKFNVSFQERGSNGRNTEVILRCGNENE